MQAGIGHTVWRGAAIAMMLGSSLTQELPAADIDWIGGFNDSWQQVFNWDPFGFPFSVRRVPGDGDRAIVNPAFPDTVRLYADTDPVNGVAISGDVLVATNGYKLTVDDHGNGLITVTGNGNGAALAVGAVQADNSAIALDADNVTVGFDASLSVLGAAIIDGDLRVESTGTVLVRHTGSLSFGSLTVARLLLAPTLFSSGEVMVEGPFAVFHSTGATLNTIGSFGSATFSTVAAATSRFDGALRIGGLAGDPRFVVLGGGEVIAQSIHLGGSSAATDAAMLVSGSDSTITQLGAATLTVGGAAGSGSATLTVQNRGLVRPGTGLTTIAETGVVALVSIGVEGGTFLPGGDVLVDGGRLSESAQSDFALAPGAVLTARGGATVGLGNAFGVNDGSALHVSDSVLIVDDPLSTTVLTVGDGSVGAVTADGPTTLFEALGRVIVGDNGGDGTLRAANGAALAVRGLDMAPFPDAGTQAVVAVESGASMNIQAITRITGSGTNSTARLAIDGAGSMVRLGAGALFAVGPGSLTGGSGRVEVTNGAVLELPAGAGEFAINELGAVLIEAATVQMAGSAGFSNRGQLHLGPSGTLLLSNGADFTNDGGTVSGVGVIDLGGGEFFNRGGVVAPGASAGDLTLLDGDLVADAESLFDVELGGTAVGQFDRLSIEGRIGLAGTLRITLIDSFLPALGDTFDIITAHAIAGAFDTVTCLQCTGRAFSVVTGSDRISLAVSAVPLPASVWLLLTAAAVLVRRSRDVAGACAQPVTTRAASAA